MRRWISLAMAPVIALPPIVVCLAFAASGAVALTTGQDHLYFCSVACRDKYRAQPAAERATGRTA